MDELHRATPLLLVLVAPVARFVRWVRRSPRCPYCASLIRSGVVRCRRCAAAPIEVPLTDLFDA